MGRYNKYDIVSVTATTDVETIGDNKVICQSIEIPTTSSCMITNVTVFDDTVTGPAIDIIFTSDSSAITQDEGKTVGEDVADLDSILSNVVGHVSLAASDYTDLADSKVGTKANINLVAKGKDQASLYMHIINRSGSGWVATSASDMKVKVGIIKS